MKRVILLFLSYTFLLQAEVAAQGRYFTTSGHVWFFSAALLEDIEAHNHQAVSFIDFDTQELAFSIPVKAFEFRKSLMQTHFNENFIESDKYPKATFSGKFRATKAIDLSTDGTYPVLVEGKLTIHGVERNVKTEGVLLVRSGTVAGKATFVVAPHDYNIIIPLLVREHIAKEVTVHVDVEYLPYSPNNP